ncbi:TadE/TadG family type IV pilus assembly protein [Clostridium cibarium]|uniref:Pilus assembly protein n=1 Tax=Clostridium cibarium TaxID=2762247 RepID=A0ABR8PPN9_9CLOT|nr:TadE family protein [Clostridium cibarium]MBD7910126.1 pilus assembly protein [Clostridium cibarium]
MFKRNKGSITVEAALVVPIFALAMLTLAFIMRLVYIDETMKNSLSHTANNISEYSYLYERSGLKDIASSASTAMGDSADKVEEQKKVVLEALSKFNKIQTQEDVQMGDIAEINAQMQGNSDLGNLMNTVKDNPGKEGIMILCAIGNSYKDKAAAAVCENISKYLFLMDLGNDKESSEDKLGKMNLVDAGGNKVSNVKDALNFEGTTFNNGEDIVIQVQYNVKVPFPLISKKVFHMKHKARVKAWIGDK